MAHERRVEAALRRLTDDGVLGEDQRAAVLAALAAEEDAARPTPGKLVAEIAAYVGAGLVLGGVLLFLAASWDDLARAGRVAVLAVVTIGLIGGGVALAGRDALFGRAFTSTVRTRLAAVLFALAAAAVAGAVGAGLDDSGNDTSWVIAVSAGLVAAVIGYLAIPSVVGMLACAGFSVAVASGLVGDVFGLRDPGHGVALFVLGLVWFALTRADAFIEDWAGYAIAVVVSVVGAQMAWTNDLLLTVALTGVVAVVCFALYATDRSPVLMIGGAGSVALAVAQLIAEHTDGLLGPVLLLLVGAVVLTTGAIVLTRSSRSE
ncbi:DUF2157 domain-containing protein [Nocardia puris]|uniref:Putative membrane protein DUF2157 n=1 Tax=Nocardia puris TaxID=208602 RepID=A0A366D632_9NOCA|nr:DUF2157 domain-containing protein [Nocardia puris]MBF6212277.1 DUF2157 domain-containing protein [Nocardia puris]MBF6366524.1 DUF2157 domain-containing protein [Nocardia puris]MBF6460866.1 DUF2157 domain-containing protein [Nocardia puris]RBO85511.1 putative membrane protein DUF2157 [Nocardia puris]